MYGEKKHQKLRELIQIANNILGGYEIGDVNLSCLVKSMSKILKDPETAILEFNEILSSISSRIPTSLYLDLKKNVEDCSKDNDLLSIQNLEKMINGNITILSSVNHVSVVEVLAPVYAWVDKYRAGLDVQFQNIFISFLNMYYEVQEIFEGGFSEADAMTRLRDKFKLKIDRIVEISLSSSKILNCNNLVLSILDVIHQESFDCTKSAFRKVIEKLAALSSSRVSKISLKAREILVSYKQPSFQERQRSMLSILSNAIKGSPASNTLNFDQNQLAQLVTSPSAILHLLTGLFFYEDVNICAAALYTYVAHTYQTYYLIMKMKPSLDYCFVSMTWSFVVRNLNDLPHSTADIRATRFGLICAFHGVCDIDFERITEKLLENAGTLQSGNLPNNVINIAVKSCSQLLDDNAANATLYELVQKKKSNLQNASVKRITFMIVHQDQFPRYFTFRASKGYSEDIIIRNAEPALAHKLELNRLQNFDIKPCFIDNRRIHIYHATAKENPSDLRFFIRAIINPGSLNPSSITPFNFLMSEGSRIMNDILDSIELLSAKHPNTDCNHVLLHFVPTFSLELTEIETGLRNIIRRYAKRLFKLRITECEVRFGKKQQVQNFVRPHRIMVFLI